MDTLFGKFSDVLGLGSFLWFEKFSDVLGFVFLCAGAMLSIIFTIVNKIFFTRIQTIPNHQ